MNSYMAKKETKKDDKKSIPKIKRERKKVTLKDETKNTLWGTFLLIVGLIILLSIFNQAGIVGKLLHNGLNNFFGIGYYLLPIVTMVSGVFLMRQGYIPYARTHIIMVILIFLSTIGILDIVANSNKESLNLIYGGMLGGVVSYPFVKMFDAIVSILILGSILIVSLLVLFDETPNLVSIPKKIWAFLNRKVELPAVPTLLKSDKVEEIETKKEDTTEAKEITEEETADDDDLIIEERLLKSKKFISKKYNPPPLDLLEKDKGKPNVGDLKGNMNIIQRTLLNFGISVEMDEVTIGPTVTRYALKPAQGVKLSRILGLQNDLALSLAAHPIRIEAPIPGKSLVGIEIPNKIKSTVGLATLLSDDKFQNSPKPLTVALGRGLSGKATFGNLAKMPHMLVAGTTGSGKSVTIHSIVTSLLYRNGPEDLKFIMVDPKRVELTLYNKIPHLLTPVITDPKKTILALKWAANEMDRRYNLLEAHQVRDIESYQNNIYAKAKKEEGLEKMPYIVILIDELADIMQAYPRELESGIVRLAQMSRAVGIHLVLSTQRPSVNVITGLIKANVPTRVALQVSSQIDSRTILDQGGAEKLLGAGDMLYVTAEMSQPERLQSAFISEEEVKKVVEYLKKEYEDELPGTIELTGNIDKGSSMFSDSLGSDDGGDDLYEDARQTVIEAGKASTSYLQRKLGVGYARAAKLIDMLEEKGVVGPGNGAKPREVLEGRPSNSPLSNEDGLINM